LGDRRRTARLVDLANRMAQHPGGTLPHKLNDPAALLAFYRLCDAKGVTHAAILAPHLRRTFELIATRETEVLIIHDATEFDYTKKRSLKDGLGQIGNGKRRGLIVQNSLAVDSVSREAIGLTGQILHRRAEVPKDETQKQRRGRESRESRLWVQGVASLPRDPKLVDVCDRGADTFEFLECEVNGGRQFVIRSAHNRSIIIGHEPTGQRARLHAHARTLEPLMEFAHEIPARLVEKSPKRRGPKIQVQRPARTAQLQVAAAPVQVRAPSSKNGFHGNQPLTIWVVRVWEKDPPAGEDPVEWILLTNHACPTAEDARLMVYWYTCRWIIEELHKAKKTGCAIEQLQFKSMDRLEPAIALLSVVALTLLQLRQAARTPDAKTRPAHEVIHQDYVEALSYWRHRAVRPDWTVHEFYMALARMGGHQNRKCDGMPGWLTLWRGWTTLKILVQGRYIARMLETRKKCAQK
jgi:hypothetical protein